MLFFQKQPASVITGCGKTASNLAADNWPLMSLRLAGRGGTIFFPLRA